MIEKSQFCVAAAVFILGKKTRLLTDWLLYTEIKKIFIFFSSAEMADQPFSQFEIFGNWQTASSFS